MIKVLRIIPVLLLTILLLELFSYLYFLIPQQSPDIEVTREEYTTDNLSFVDEVAYHEDDILYNATVIYDEFGRRTIRQTPDPLEDNIIFFGCSYTEGHGLSWNETLYSRMHNLTGLNVYNFAVGGGSLNTMLAKLKGYDITNRTTDNQSIFGHINTSNKNIGIYNFLPLVHTRRIFEHDAGPSWLLPEFAYEDGEFVLKNHSDNFSSSFLDLMRIGHISDDQIYFVTDMIEYFMELYEKRFDHPMVLVINPLYEHQDVTIRYKEEFEKRGIEYLSYDFVERGSDFRIPVDNHPNAKFNEIFADHLSSDITQYFS